MLEREKWFYFNGGRTAQDLDELAAALKDIPDEEFTFHVNPQKNDFANWVEGVLGEASLAAGLRTVIARKDTIDMIKKHTHRSHKKDVKLSAFDILNGPSAGTTAGTPAESAPDEKGAGTPDAAAMPAAPAHAYRAAHHAMHHADSIEGASAPAPLDVSSMPADKPVEGEASSSASQHPAHHVSHHAGHHAAHTAAAGDAIHSAEGSADSGAGSEASLQGAPPDLGKSIEEELEKEDLDEIVKQTKHQLEIEGRNIDEKAADKVQVEAQHHRFIVKEFIYGFLIGVVFGLIMLGALLRIKV